MVEKNLTFQFEIIDARIFTIRYILDRTFLKHSNEYEKTEK